MKSIKHTRVLKLALVLPALVVALAVLPGCKEKDAADDAAGTNAPATPAETK